MTTPFVHLHLHSHYSFLRSTLRLRDTCRRVAELGMPAVALTDDANLFGAVEFCQAATQAGIRPILGCDLYVANGPLGERGDATGGERPWHRLVLLVRDEIGYRNLVQLISLAYLEGFHRKPLVDDEALARHSAGLIALSGGGGGRVATLVRQGRHDQAEAAAASYRDMFGADSFYLELQDHGLAEEREHVTFCRAAAARLGIGTVATNDPHFLERDHFEAHRALTCIGTGTTLDDKPVLHFTPDHYLRTPEEMAALFAEIPEALRATVEIAERCDHRVELREPMMPRFDVGEGETLESYFRRRCREGLEDRLASRPPAKPREFYHQRLERELDVICQMGYPGYFLITWDLIRHAREQGIPVGPGRGSAAGSLVSYALRITDLDPIQHGLLFERFLNPERKSLPDIDIDFCQRRRAEVIRHVQQQYGEDHVAQIITFGTLNARSVIRDVGRVMNMSYGEVDRIAKLVPEELGVTLDKALADSPALEELRASDPRVAHLIGIARQLEGLARNPGVHAAGVIIAPRPLTELVPLFKTGRDEVTTQFAKDEAEAVGLLKMDFLGLKTLTVLHDALASVERAGHPAIDLESLPLDDEKAYELFRQARTLGVFQFESSGMRDVLRKLQPTNYVDLTALNALYRPGPLKAGVIDDYIARRHGKVKVTYPHPDLEMILESTYGIMAFQEQVMQVAVQLAGFSLGEADNLRKAMGKKKPEVMAAQRVKFVDGAKARGVEERTAVEIFELMEYFAGYGFNKSHSAAYALVAYWCAYLKAHHPAHFLAALLTSERDNTDKVVRYIAECRDVGIEVLPPDVNESDVDFTVVDERAIRFGLSAIKGVGRAAVESILQARRRVGRFEDLFHLCTEIDLRLNNKKVLEALVKAGALDSLGETRPALMFSLQAACDAAASVQADRASGQGSLFGPEGDDESTAVPRALPSMPDWPAEDRLRHEKEVLGFYVSGHPLERHAALLESLSSTPLSELAERAGREVTVVGVLTGLRRTRTKKGDWMAFLQLEDLTSNAEVIVFPKLWEEAAAVAEPDSALCVRGTVEEDSDTARILAEEVRPLGQAEQEAAAGLVVRIPDDLTAEQADDVLARASEILASHPGDCPVRFVVRVAGIGDVTVEADDRHRVRPDGTVVSGLEDLLGTGRVSLSYR